MAEHSTNLQDRPLDPPTASSTEVIGRREIETLKNELLSQFEHISTVAERLDTAYRQANPGPDESELDAELRVGVAACPATAQQLIQFSREILYDFDGVERSKDQQELHRRVRHDLRNSIGPIHGISQEVEFLSEPGSTLASVAAELRFACDAATRLLDFLTERNKCETTAHDHEIISPNPITAPVEVEVSRILIADDNEITASQLSRHLARQGHSVLVVNNGQAAIDALTRHRDFDLVLLDVIMPGVDGVEVLSWIKNESELRHVPVIMISGLDDDERTVNCIARGAEDYLSKPVNLVLLDARVGSCLRRRQAEKHRLEQYFSRELAGELACGNENLLQTRDANVSILFCDIRRFSSISERVGARTTIEWIGSTMGELSRIVFREQGVLIDFTGDGLMAMWGAPKTLENHADLAVGAALSMLDALDELNNLWASRLNERFQLGIGINSGSAQVGVIGSSPKFKYGPLGATVNLASRVEGTTKYLRAPLVVTQHTKNQLQDRKKYSIRRLCRAKVVNMHQPVSLYEIHRFDKNLTPLFKTYQCALRFYENREFQSAARVLGRLLATYEELSDVPSQMLMARVLSAMSDVSRFEPVWEFGK